MTSLSDRHPDAVRRPLPRFDELSDLRTISHPGTRRRGDPLPQSSFLADLWSVAIRALRALPREPEVIIPSLIIPVSFFAVDIGAFQDFAERGIPGLDFRALQLPTAIIFAVTDIQSGYFDRLLMTPMHRLSLLLGLMIADPALVMGLALPVLALGFAVGIRFETGAPGVLLFILLTGLWGLVFTGFPYAIALETGSPGAVGASFLLFLTTATLPQEALTGWLDTVAAFNPMTYLLAALRQGLAATLGVGVGSLGLALAALRGRVERG